MSIYTHTSIVRDGSNLASFVFQVRLFLSWINASLVLTIPIYCTKMKPPPPPSWQDQRNRPLDWVGLGGGATCTSRSPTWQWVGSRQSCLVFWYKYMHFVFSDLLLIPLPFLVRKSFISSFIFVSFVSLCLCGIENLASLRFCCYHVRLISDKTESKVSLFIHCFLLNIHSSIFLLNALSHVFFIFLY